jgi:hypothetical protein
MEDLHQDLQPDVNNDLDVTRSIDKPNAFEVLQSSGQSKPRKAVRQRRKVTASNSATTSNVKKQALIYEQGDRGSKQLKSTNNLKKKKQQLPAQERYIFFNNFRS